MKPSAVSRHTQRTRVCRVLHFLLGRCCWRPRWCTVLPSEVRRAQQPASQDSSRWPLSAGVLQWVGPELGQGDLCHAGIQKVRFAVNLPSDGAVFVSVSLSSNVDLMSVISAMSYFRYRHPCCTEWSHDSSKPLSALAGSTLPIRFSPRLL